MYNIASSLQFCHFLVTVLDCLQSFSTMFIWGRLFVGFKTLCVHFFSRRNGYRAWATKKYRTCLECILLNGIVHTTSLYLLYCCISWAINLTHTLARQPCFVTVTREAPYVIRNITNVSIVLTVCVKPSHFYDSTLERCTWMMRHTLTLSDCKSEVLLIALRHHH